MKENVPVLESAFSLARCSSFSLKGASFNSIGTLSFPGVSLELEIECNGEVRSTCAISIATFASLGNRILARLTAGKTINTNTSKYLINYCINVLRQRYMTQVIETVRHGSESGTPEFRRFSTLRRLSYRVWSGVRCEKE